MRGRKRPFRTWWVNPLLMHVYNCFLLLCSVLAACILCFLPLGASKAQIILCKFKIPPNLLPASFVFPAACLLLDTLSIVPSCFLTSSLLTFIVRLSTARGHHATSLLFPL
jgi:hypothetical protein